ncbi:MAG: hypothetical protein ACR2GD_09255 [Pyrinomonadaceae bacterium]
MKIHLLKKKAAPEQMREIVESLESYIKLAADVEKEVLQSAGLI